MATAKIVSIENSISSSSIQVKVISDGRIVTTFTIAENSTNTPSPVISVPECDSQGDYAGNHIEVIYNGTTYAFYQCANTIFYTYNGTWNEVDTMEFVNGASPGDNDISLEVTDVEGSGWVIGDIVE